MIETLQDEFGDTGIVQYPDQLDQPKADKNDRRTPRWFFLQCVDRFGVFVTDVAATAANSQCADHCQDGLNEEWSRLNWCNPPYGPPGTIEKWIAKARKERDWFSRRTLMLLPADTSTSWFQDVSKTEYVELVPFRLAFEAPDGSTKGNSAKFGSVLVYIAPKIARPKKARKGRAA